jgi:hypothetical protein
MRILKSESKLSQSKGRAEITARKLNRAAVLCAVTPELPSMTELLAFLLASMGLTILIVWPQDGPGAWLRENVLRKALPGKGKEMLDCYICSGFWCGLAFSPAWWLMCRERWTLFGCLYGGKEYEEKKMGRDTGCDFPFLFAIFIFLSSIFL